MAQNRKDPINSRSNHYVTTPMWTERVTCRELSKCFGSTIMKDFLIKPRTQLDSTSDHNMYN